MSAPERKVPCVCGKTFGSEAGVRQHLRRMYCRGPNVSTTCTECSRTFKTFAGMRQHLRLAHSAIYNAGLEAEVDQRPMASSRWSEDELFAMARAEVAYTGKFINIELNTKFPTRSLEAIKSRRMQKDYKELIASMRSVGGLPGPSAPDLSEDIEIRDQGSPTAPEVLEHSITIDPLIPPSPDVRSARMSADPVVMLITKLTLRILITGDRLLSLLSLRDY